MESAATEKLGGGTHFVQIKRGVICRQFSCCRERPKGGTEGERECVFVCDREREGEKERVVKVDESFGF